jgi:hypothetical protein
MINSLAINRIEHRDLVARRGGWMRTRLLFLSLAVWAWSIVNAGAADVTGRWKVTISANGSTLVGVALLNQKGNEISGSIGVDEQNQHPLDGVVDGNRITLTTHPRPGRTVAFAKCELTVDGDKMSGTTEGGDLGGKATIELTRATK